MDKLVLDLIDFIKSNYSPEQKLKQSKEGGLTEFFRKGGKSLCYIETKGEKATVTVVIGETLNDKVLSANISQKAKDIFKNAKQFHDGKWLFFDMKTKSDLEDIKSLLLIKRQPKFEI